MLGAANSILLFLLLLARVHPAYCLQRAISCTQHTIHCPEGSCVYTGTSTHLLWEMDGVQLTTNRKDDLGMSTTFDNGFGTLTWHRPPLAYNGSVIHCRAFFNGNEVCEFDTFVVRVDDCEYTTTEITTVVVTASSTSSVSGSSVSTSSINGSSVSESRSGLTEETSFVDIGSTSSTVIKIGSWMIPVLVSVSAVLILVVLLALIIVAVRLHVKYGHKRCPTFCKHSGGSDEVTTEQSPVVNNGRNHEALQNGSRAKPVVTQESTTTSCLHSVHREVSGAQDELEQGTQLQQFVVNMESTEENT